MNPLLPYMLRYTVHRETSGSTFYKKRFWARSEGEAQALLLTTLDPSGDLNTEVHEVDLDMEQAKQDLAELALWHILRRGRGPLQTVIELQGVARHLEISEATLKKVIEESNQGLPWIS
jgi:hypothetical protein